MRKFILMLFIILLSIVLHAEKVSDLPQLTTPRFMDIHKDRLYVTDDATIFVYSLESGKPERSFGTKGHGPGEFSPNPRWDSHLNIQVLDQGIFLHTMNKMGWLDFKGQPLSDLKIPFFCTAISPLGNRFITKRYEQINGKHYYSIVVVNDSLEKIAMLDQIEYRYNGTFQPIQNPILFQVYQDKIYILNGAKGPTIFIYSSNGETIGKIPFPCQRRKVNDPIKQQAREWLNSKGWYRQIPDQNKSKMVFPKYLPPFIHFIIKDRTIYIQTFQQQKEKTKFVIIDPDSHQSKEIFLPLANRSLFNPAPYSFSQNNYHVITENGSTETWELHRININNRNGQ